MSMMTVDILRYLLYFIIYSFLGWVMESILKTILEKKFVNSGFLHGPYCPIYGFGALIMMFFLGGLKNNILLLFLAGFFVLSIWEYIVGWFLEKTFHTKYWDYTENRFNIKGRVCLLNSFYWGILGVAFTLWAHPIIINVIASLPQNALIYLDIILYIALITDMITSLIKVKSIEKSMEKIKQINEAIKEKLEQLKELNRAKEQRKVEENAKLVENIKAGIEELKLQQNKLKLGMYKQLNRLKKAFPTMQSEIATKFLNQKVDLQLLKEKIKNKAKEKRK